MSTSTVVSEEGSASSGMRADESSCSLAPDLSAAPISSHYTHPPELKPKKRRNKPGNPDPEAEVVALSPRSLTCTDKYSCEICGKGFQREQNLQLHRRGHNLPWTLKHGGGGGGGTSRKKVYVCPEESCAHHHPSRALGDLTGIKKHFLRKHGEKRWACERCSKKYAVLSDCRAHARACGTREYRCNCGAIFSRKDSFATHRAFCDALAEESSRIMAAAAAAVATPAAANGPGNKLGAPPVGQQQPPPHQLLFSWQHPKDPHPYPAVYTSLFEPKVEEQPLRHSFVPRTDPISGVAPPVGQRLPRAAVLQGAVTASHPLSRTSISISCTTTFVSGMLGDGGDLPARQRANCPLTRDFLGMAGEGEDGLLSFNNVSTCCCTGGHATAGMTDAARPPPAAGDTSASQAWRC